MNDVLIVPVVSSLSSSSSSVLLSSSRRSKLCCYTRCCCCCHYKNTKFLISIVLIQIIMLLHSPTISSFIITTTTTTTTTRASSSISKNQFVVTVKSKSQLLKKRFMFNSMLSKTTTTATATTPSSTVVEDTTTTTESATTQTTKYVTFIRHGCTYMNEYLGGADNGKEFGSSKFTDVFSGDSDRIQKYTDTKLSPTGIRQCTNMANTIVPPTYMYNCQLILVSPLTRALQTYDIGMKQHFSNLYTNNTTTSNSEQQQLKQPPPIIALPIAAERCYLTSDVGTSIDILEKQFPYVDFETECSSTKINRSQWWYTPSSKENYIEWRPTSQQQSYAYYGENYNEFNERMIQLYNYINNRDEQYIAIVCHHGVIEWFIQYSFDNCQHRTIDWSTIQINDKISINNERNNNKKKSFFQKLFNF